MALRNLVLAHHMEDLKETTHKIHYERFRFDKLREMMGGPRDYRVSQQHTIEPFRPCIVSEICYIFSPDSFYFKNKKLKHKDDI